MFLVVEGIDGAGGSTQSKLIKNFLEDKGFKVELIKYPDYSNAIGKAIKSFLNRKFEINAEVQFYLFALDMLKDKEKIERNLREGKVVLCDRYIFSTFSYQCFAKKFSLEKGLQIVKILNLPKPDLVILLDISPQTSLKRKRKEKKKLDRHEEDLKLLSEVREGYFKIADMKIFSEEWVFINAEKSIKEVFGEIKKVLVEKLDIRE